MKLNMIIITIILIVGLLILGGLAISAKSKIEIEKEPVAKEKKYLKYGLFIYTIDPNPEQTRLKAVEEYKQYPPLRRERFRRKVKMLWGIDVNDYPNNSIIQVGRYYGSYIITLSKNYQLMDGFISNEDENDPTIYTNHERSVYSYVRAYAFINDSQARDYLSSYAKRMQDKYFKGYRVRSLGLNPDSNDSDLGVESADFFVLLYHNALFGSNPYWMKYNMNLNSPMGLLAPGPVDDDVRARYSDIRMDMLTLFLKKELSKGRKFKRHGYYGNEEDLWLGFNLNDSVSAAPGPFSNLCLYPTVAPNPTLDEEREGTYLYRPWYNYTAEKGVCSLMNFVLQLENKYMNKCIIRYMSGQIDKNIASLSEWDHEKLRKNIKTNNYYGYSVLREFLTNPMREMPTLEKIGTNFTAKVKEENVLLFLEPFSDSYDIDTIHPTETFKAYEMGHDNYYFIEIDKPVESPVADKDGYAIILDRKETIYGYVLKSKVKEYTSLDVLEEERYTNTTQSKQGVINDKDGYVNVREEPNTQSKIVGKIMDKEIFNYWLTSDNWYIVETKDGTRGYVYKDRIREKYETGGWTIDE